MTTSHLLLPLPRITPFPALPSSPGAGLESWLTSNHRSTVRSSRGRFGSPSRLACDPANATPNDAGVRAGPFWKVPIAPICQPPAILPSRSFRPWKNGGA